MAKSFRSPGKVLRRLKLTPLVASHIKNWPSFMYHYALGLKPEAPYVFRNGARIKIGRAIDHVPIIEIFLKGDYGVMPNNATIIDMGANIGVFSIYATTNRNNKVYAYEPFRSYCDNVEENARLNGKDKDIKAFNYAVAGKAENRTLFINGTDFFFPTLMGKEFQVNGDTIQVKCTTLAEIIESNALSSVDMLKIDCEGAEYDIFYNAPADVFTKIKEIRMEYHNLDNEERNVEKLKEFLTGKGYTITRIQANTDTNGNLWVERK